MTVYRLPSLDKAAPIVDGKGRITPYFQRFWQNLTITSIDGANQNGDIAALQSAVTTINGQISSLNTGLAGKAPSASPAFTGNPTAPTPSAGDNDTSIATTAFVTDAVSTLSGTVTSALAGKVAKSTFLTWTAATGTAERTTFATYDAPTASGTYDQTEMQAVMDALQDVSRRVKALIDDLKT